MNTDDRALADLIARLRRLLAKATPLPWTYEDDDEGSSMGWICAPNPTYPELSGESIFDVCGDSAQQANNAEFAVAALAALPTLLDRLEAFHAKPVVDGEPLEMLIEKVTKAIADPGLYCDFRGDRGMSHWQAEAAVLAVMAHADAALQSPPPVVSGEAACECGIGDQSDIGHYHESWCPALSTPPVVEEGRREAAIDIIRDVQVEYREDGLASINAASAAKAADAILALTPVEGVGGWIIGNGDGCHFRVWENGIPIWTKDRTKATRYARREDAEAVHAEDEDAWTVEPYSSTPVAAQGVEVREALREAHFLCDRLDELDFSVDMEEFTRLHFGHVDPSHSRLKAALATLGAPHEG